MRVTRRHDVASGRVEPCLQRCIRHGTIPLNVATRCFGVSESRVANLANCRSCRAVEAVNCPSRSTRCRFVHGSDRDAFNIRRAPLATDAPFPYTDAVSVGREFWGARGVVDLAARHLQESPASKRFGFQLPREDPWDHGFDGSLSRTWCPSGRSYLSSWSARAPPHASRTDSGDADCAGRRGILRGTDSDRFKFTTVSTTWLLTRITAEDGVHARGRMAPSKMSTSVARARRYCRRY
jgi:hypothetical protein